MVFPSIPVYLDHPNWHQLQQPNQVTENSQLHPAPPPPPAGGGGTVRPGSMVDRARLAKIPQPEAGLKCPRCESTNTKFCYFNNYSLSQPRHFCKTCRRYWTRGGALRNVPVGGGCRRNKRTKGGSKPQPTAETGPNNKSTSESPGSTCNNSEMSNHFTQLSPQMPLMTSLHNLAQYGSGNINIGSNLTGFQAQMAAAAGGGGGSLADQWRLPSFSGTLEQHMMNMYTFQGQGGEGRCLGTGNGDELRPLMSNSGETQMGAVKVEESQGHDLSIRQIFGVSENNQYWGGNPAPLL
ncbi:hypothetical protein NMG60_11033994 [Bertholletia excelsa]